jgi:hypothetical protein
MEFWVMLSTHSGGKALSNELPVFRREGGIIKLLDEGTLCNWQMVITLAEGFESHCRESVTAFAQGGPLVLFRVGVVLRIDVTALLGLFNN